MRDFNEIKKWFSQYTEISFSAYRNKFLFKLDSQVLFWANVNEYGEWGSDCPGLAGRFLGTVRWCLVRTLITASAVTTLASIYSIVLDINS